MIRILGLSLYGPLAASNRYRLGQFVPGLADAGIDLHVTSLLGDDYLVSRFEGRPIPWTSLLISSWYRIQRLLDRSGFDGAILHCELFPLMPSCMERLLLPKTYIYDFDDAFFLKYRQGRLAFLQPFLAGKFDHVMAGAAAVTAGNVHLARYARSYNARTYVLPTVVDMRRYHRVLRPESPEFTVGWIGSPSTVPYLTEVVAALVQLACEGPVRLLVIGGDGPVIPGVCVESRPWEEATEIEQINRFDVGVMPLPDTDWARGKCAFKLIQCMACGVPVVASRVGANIDVVGADCGFLVDGPEDWLDAFRFLRDDKAARTHMGKSARSRVEASYSLEGSLPILTDVIKGCFEQGSQSGR